jgi:D-3-phosphoglycerate dehydrogenase / 2-oxoglutarate reductase
VPENIDSMAEAAVLMILAGLYDLAGALERFRTSDVWSSAPLTARMLKGKTIGLLGYGGIARGIVQRLSGWSADFCATTRHPPKDPGFAVRFLPLDEMLAASDVVCVLAPITDETRGLLDARRLALTKQGSVLICLSRGGIIDETALAVLARAGHFGAVCLDVFEREPLPKDSPLRELKNALLTPHSIGLTREMRPRLIEAGVVSVMRVLKGEAPLYVRNPEVLPAWRARWQG